MHRRNLSLVLLAALAPALAPALARADRMSFANSTDIVAYASGAPTAYFGGANPYVGSSAIGAEFATPSFTLGDSAAPGGGVTLEFSFVTAFSGALTVNGATVSYADIFLRPGLDGYSAAPFTYGIALGAQGGNGGVGAGVYQVQQLATSQDIWAGRAGYIYGGAYTNTTQFAPGAPGYSAFAAPTVIRAGQLLDAVSLSSTALPGSLYDVRVAFTLTAAQAAPFANGFDLFWGTGDCANGAFFAEVHDLQVTEPASFLMLVFGATFVALARGGRGRRRDAAAAR
jgi:hypothetical protein